MRRAANGFIWGLLAVSAVASLSLLAGMWTVGSRIADVASPVSEGEGSEVVAPVAHLAVGTQVKVAFDVDDPLLDSFTALEARDQRLDWLLWLIANDVARSDDDLNRSLFDAPLVRHGFSREVARFEYGPTRSASLGNGDVIALIPRSDEAQRRDNLAGIADEQRKNQGRIPERLFVFEYDIGADAAANLQRLADLHGSELFTAAYGYQEASVSNLKDLEVFMAATDDLVSVRIENEKLRLGGRKLNANYQGIRPVDVATVWQANVAMAKSALAAEGRMSEFHAVWKQKENEFNARWGTRRDYSGLRDVELAKLQKQHDNAQMALMKEIGSVSGIGFSLDPDYDYAALREVFAQPTLIKMAVKAKAPPVVVELFKRMEREFLNQLEQLPSGEDTKDSEAIVRAMGLTPRVAVGLSGVEVEHFDAAVSALEGAGADIVPLLKLIDELEGGKGIDSINDLNVMRLTLGEFLDQLTKSFQFQAARYDGALGGTEVGMVLFYTDLTAKLWALDFQRSTPSREVADFRPLTDTRVSQTYFEEMKTLSSTRLWFGPNELGYQTPSDDELLFARTATRIYAASSNPLEPGKEVPPNAKSEAFLGWWNDHYASVAEHEPLYQRLNEVMKWSLVAGWLEHHNRSQTLSYLQPVEVDRSAWFPSWARGNDQLRFNAWKSISFYDRGQHSAKTEALPILFSEPYDSGDGNRTWVLSGGVSLGSKTAFKPISELPEALAPNLRRAGFRYESTAGAEEMIAARGARYQFAGSAANEASFAPAQLKVFAPDGAKLRGRFGDLMPGEFERTIHRAPKFTSARLQANGAEVGSLSIDATSNGFRVAWRARELDDGVMLARALSVSKDYARTILDNANVLRAVRAPDGETFFVQFAGSRRWMELTPEGKPAADLATGWSGRAAEFRPDAKSIQFRWHEAESAAGMEESAVWLRGTREPLRASRRAAGEEGVVADDAQAITQDPAAWKLAHDQRLQIHLDYLDEVAAHRPRLLPDAVNELKQEYPHNSRLLLREALAELRSNNPSRVVQTLEEMNLPSRDATRGLLDEFNARLGPLPKDMQADLAVLEDAMYARSAHASAAEEVVLAVDRNTLVIEARLNKPRMDAVPPHGSIPAEARVFVEDSPSLNNLDWVTGRAEAINQVVDRKLGTVYALARGDLASYRPHRIHIDGKTYHSTEVRPTGAMYRAAGNAARTGNSAVTGCNPESVNQARTDCSESIYLVSDNRGAAAATASVMP